MLVLVRMRCLWVAGQGCWPSILLLKRRLRDSSLDIDNNDNNDNDSNLGQGGEGEKIER